MLPAHPVALRSSRTSTRALACLRYKSGVQPSAIHRGRWSSSPCLARWSLRCHPTPRRQLESRSWRSRFETASGRARRARNDGYDQSTTFRARPHRAARQHVDHTSHRRPTRGSPRWREAVCRSRQLPVRHFHRVHGCGRAPSTRPRLRSRFDFAPDPASRMTPGSAFALLSREELA